MAQQSESLSDTLLVEQRELSGRPIEVWTLNRPDRLNAINSDLIKRLNSETRRLKKQLEKDLGSCRVLILRSSLDKAFAAGADISEMKDFGQDEAESFSRAGQEAFGRLEHTLCPTIAAIQGFALGGGLELAMCCDILVADSKAQLGQPESHLGLIPGFGATARFVDRLGAAKALQLLYTGQRILAPEALSLGLLQEVAPEGTAPFDRALQIATEICEKTSPLALSFIKRIVRESTNERFDETEDLESKLFGEIFESEDKAEGVSAFLEKRKPKFTGR